MLQAPSHLSRVCGHGHIKKFWLMQTQKESQACENKSSVLFPSSPSASRPANRGAVKGLDSSPWSSSSAVSHSPCYGDAGATPAKHSSFTCAESLSPPSHFCKASPPLSPHSTGSSGAVADKESTYVQRDGVDSFSRTLGRDAHPATPSPRSYPLNVASELEYKCRRGSAAVMSEADLAEPLPQGGGYGCEDPLSTSAEGSPELHASHGHSHYAQQGKSTPFAAEDTSHSRFSKVEDRISPSPIANDMKPSSSHSRLSLPSAGLESVLERGRSNGVIFGSRTLENSDRDHPHQSSYVQHPALKACTFCGTTKTPMWRSGPQGPKSLCNACGIRFKKYRSFPGQNESPEFMVSPLLGPVGSKSLARPLKRKQNSVLSPCEPSRPQKMCFKSAVSDVVARQQQKKSKWHQLVVKREQSELKELNRDSSSPWHAHSGPASLKKIYGCAPFQSKLKKLAPMDDHISVSRVFAKDEEEAAVLLMHLSCGLVY
eukprot:c15278_g1_i1 orf=677-2137(+)